MSDTALKAKEAELKRLQEKMPGLLAAQENAAADYTEARELLDGLRQSNANNQDIRERNKNNPQVMKGLEEFDKMLATGIQLEKDRRLAAEKIADEFGQTKRDIARLQTEMEQLKTEMEVGGIKDDLDIDFDSLRKQGESTNDLLQSTAKTTQAHLESNVTHQASTVDRVKKDIDLCTNLQSKLQTERAALSSGVIDRVMNWRKISEIDKNLKEVTAKKVDREAMLKEAKAGLETTIKELDAHKKSFGVEDGAKVDNVGTQAHISFHGHGDKQQQAQQVKLPNTGKGIDDLTNLVPKAPHVHR
jgi:hypothetical protein